MPGLGYGTKTMNLFIHFPIDATRIGGSALDGGCTPSAKFLDLFCKLPNDILSSRLAANIYLLTRAIPFILIWKTCKLQKLQFIVNTFFKEKFHV